MGRGVKISWVGGSKYHGQGVRYTKKETRARKVSTWGLFFSENTGGNQNYIYQECIFVDRNFTQKKQKAQRYHKWGCLVFFLISSETIRPFGTKLCRNVRFMVPQIFYASCSSEVKYRNKRPKGVKKCVVGFYLWSVYFSTNLEDFFQLNLLKAT